VGKANYPAGAYADPNAPYNDDPWKEYEQELANQTEDLGLIIIPIDVVTVPPEAQVKLEIIYLELMKRFLKDGS
jgi:hypothetical protein